MNDKFWDLKKEKQDSMIGSALKVFALNGFSHASTDEIVAEASVSKGLLFHYFYSKAGLYSFLIEYCARFAVIELNSELRRKEALPFFELARALTHAEASSMRRYPYLMLFLERAKADEAVSEQDQNSLELLDARLLELFDASILPDPMTSSDAERISGMLRLIRTDTAASLLRSGSFTPERYIAAVSESILFFEKFYTASRGSQSHCDA